MGMELATAYVSIVPETKMLAQQLSGSQMTGIGNSAGQVAGKGMAASMGGILATAGVAAAAAAAVAIGKTIVDGVQSAISQGEALNKVNVVFENAAESVIAFADKGAKSLGMTKLAALEAAGTFGNLLTATGLSEDMAAQFSTTMVGLGADLASFNNTSVDDALQALRAGLSGETEPLKRFGVNLNEEMLKAKALELGLVSLKDGQEKYTGMLDPATKQQAAYALIMEQTAKAQGDFARTSDGAANKQKIIAAQWADIKTKIGEGFVPVVEKATAGISQMLSAFGHVFALIKEGESPLFAIQSALWEFFNIDTMDSPVVAQIKDLGAALNDVYQTVMPTVAEWYAKYIGPTFAKIRAAFAPIMAEVIPTLTAIAEHFKTAWPVMKQVLEPIVQSISGMISGLFTFIAGIVRAVMAVVRGDWDAAWEGVKTAFKGVWEFISSLPLVVAITKSLSGVKEAIYKYLIMPLNDAIDAMNRIFGTNFKRINFNVGGGKTTGRQTGGIPMMAEGGIISGPTSGYLVMAHGTEVVTPIDKVNRGVIVVADSRFTDERKLSAFVRRANSEDIGYGGINAALGIG